MNAELVHASTDGALTTTSEIIAEGVGIQHKNVLETIRKNQADFEEFGRVAFETRTRQTAGGAQKTNIAILNREQAMFAMTLFRNNDIVIEFKKRLIKAFVELENKVAAPALTGPELMARALIEANATMKAIEADRDKIVAELEAAAPKIEYHDTFVAESDLIQFRTLANQLNIGEQALRRELQRHGWIYDIPCERWSNKKNRKVIEHRWRCKADKKHYFQLVPQHEAPRLNGEVRQTLKITPDGAVAITKALRKWGVLDWPTIEGIA